MPKYGNFENQPVSRKPLPVELKQAQFHPPGVERGCATSGTLANGQLSCPNMAILKIAIFGMAVSRKPLPVELKQAQFHPLGVEKGYTCNLWHFGQWPSFMPKYCNFENRPVSRKPLPVELKHAQFRPPRGRKRVYVQLMEL